jgi:transposase InsO family protein
MKEHAKEFRIEKMALVFQVSISGYYVYVQRGLSLRDKEDQKLVDQIKQIYQEGRKMYGSPRVHAVLQRRGVPCSRKRVAKLMREHGIAAKMRKSWKRTTKQGKRKAAANLVKQEFIKEEPNHTWVSDITYVKTKEGWLYLSAVIDLFSRKVVGLSMGERIDTNLIERAVRQALCHRHPYQGLIHHSDRGSQYTSEEFEKLAKENGIVLSMSSTGNCYDNAVAESFFHTLKTEHIYQEKFATREEAKRSIFEYIEVFYNRQRAHSFLGYLSPEQFEQNWSKQAI